MIILITYYDEETKLLLISHGVDLDTGFNVIFPPEYPGKYGYFNTDMDEWVLN